MQFSSGQFSDFSRASDQQLQETTMRTQPVLTEHNLFEEDRDAEHKESGAKAWTVL